MIVCNSSVRTNVTVTRNLLSISLMTMERVIITARIYHRIKRNDGHVPMQHKVKR